MKTPLERLICEAKAEDALPRVSDDAWDAMEARLMDQVKRQQDLSTPRRYGRFASIGVAALAIAAATILVVKRPRGPSLEDQPEAILPDFGAGALRSTEGTGEIRVAGRRVSQGQVLRAGDLVEVQGARAFLERPQKVTWLLDGAPAPEGTGAARARVTSVGDSLVLSLEDGAVEAQVNPVPTGEAFAVDIPTERALVRVAVHGTHLRVARTGSLVTVDVTEGVVSIGLLPSAAPRTLVRAPSHVEFDAGALDATFKIDDGMVRSAVPLKTAPVTASLSQNDAPQRVDRHRVVDPAPKPSTPRAADRAHTQAGPGPEPVVTSADPGSAVAPNEAIARAVRECAAARPRDEKVRVSVASSLRLKVGPAGDVQAAQFDPPLLPEIQTCAALAIYKLVITGAEGTTLTVPIAFAY